MPLEISYSFAGFQSANPSAPLPAARLDTAFSDIEQAHNGLEQALADIRRSDGRLKNSSIGFDALDDEVKKKLGGSGSITTNDLDPDAFATQEAAETGASATKIMTPLRTKQALDETRRFATVQEVLDGEQTTVVMSPASTVTAIGNYRPYASEEEAQAASANNRCMTPYATAVLLSVQRPVFSETRTITFGALPIGGLSTVNTNLAGAEPGDHVLVAPVSVAHPAGVLLQGLVTGPNSVSVTAVNSSGVAHTLQAAEYRVTARRL